MRSRVAAFLLAALALASGLQPGNATAEDAAQKHFLWKVTGSKGVVYLFGTVHIGKPDFYPLPAIIEDSFRHADTLVEEIKQDPSDAAQMKRWVAEHGLYPGSDMIANHLSEETISHLAIYLREKSWQEQQVIAKMRPWAIASIIEDADKKRLGLDPANGLDKHFLTEAEGLRKPVDALETFASHLQLLSDMANDVEDKYLMQTLAESEKPTSQLEMTIDAWRTGDSERLQELLTQTVNDYPRLKPLMKRLLDDRNDAMTEKIEQFLSTSKTYFVAVGAAHMVGEHGIVSQLRAKQLSVEQL
jgi:uncharacterized protein YbaP (TraB family)